MNPESMALVRIRKEIELELHTLERIPKEYLSVPQDIPGWVRTRTKASLLHDFYTGIERVFSRIAQELNGGLPNTEQWHRDLLQEMTLELENIRPPVISEGLFDDLVPYLRFRHLFRNLYGFELDWDKMKELDLNFKRVSSQVFTELQQFLHWMKSQSEL